MQATAHDGCVTFSLIRDEKDKMNYVPQFKLIFFVVKRTLSLMALHQGRITSRSRIFSKFMYCLSDTYINLLRMGIYIVWLWRTVNGHCVNHLQTRKASVFLICEGNNIIIFE